MSLKTYHVVSLSGGQDSTAMLVRMLEIGMHVDYAIFCDTGAEFDIMYCYIEYLDKYLNDTYNFKITKLSSGISYEDIIKKPLGERAISDRVGRPKGITRVIGMDACTRDLKIKVIDDFCNELSGNIVHYNGYTYNEVIRNRGGAKERIGNGFRYPLYEWKWNESQIGQYLKSKGLFNPLYNHFTRTGCFLCPKQSEKSWYMLWKHYKHHFEYAKTLEDWAVKNNAVSKYFVYRQTKDSKIYKKNPKEYEFVSLHTLETEFINQKQFSFQFDDDGQDISCHCK